MYISEFNKIKSECKICIGSKMCPPHKEMWIKILKEC